MLVLLSACGGGSGAAGSGAGASVPASQGVPPEPAGAGGAPAAASADPLSGQPSAPPAPDAMQPAVADAPAGPATATTLAQPEQPVTAGTAVAAALPDGATPCQPSICPAFSANGSVTNILGSDNPTAARGYLVAPDQAASGGYPDLGNLPTLVLPRVPITVGVPAP